LGLKVPQRAFIPTSKVRVGYKVDSHGESEDVPQISVHAGGACQ
jgi:hypothetical protein